MLDKNEYNTKVTKPTMKKAKKEDVTPKRPLRRFHFPLHGVTVEATDVHEANKKLSAIINKD